MTAGGKSREGAVSEGVIAGLLFGTAAIFIRMTPTLDSISITFWRLIIASVALAAILKVKQVKGFPQLKHNLSRVLLLGILIGIHFALFISSVKETSILNATVLVNTSPITTMTVSVLIYGARPKKISVVGVLISFLGIAMIGVGDASAMDPGRLIGDAQAILAAVAEAFYLNLGREIRSRIGLLTIMLPVFGIAGSAVFFFSFVTGNGPQIPTAIGILLPLLGLGLLPTALGHSLYFSSLSNLKPFETATLALIEPIGATILGAMIFQEFPGLLFIMGSVIVLTGVVLVIKE